jgi:galactose mutarotase-like enzyme
MYTIENKELRISVRQKGAELSSIQKISSGREYLWNANPEVWGSHSPVLFPIIGRLKEDTYFYKNKKYRLQGHGFIRNNDRMVPEIQNKNSVVFSLNSSEETLVLYPFHFKFEISYQLENHQVIILHRVINTGNETMFFSIGGHPAFKCPFLENEQYSDYFLLFEKKETALCWGPTEDGLIGPELRSVIDNENRILLDDNTFNKGALVFKELNSSKISLVSRKTGPVLSVNFSGFPYLGIWAKPKAQFVCIEPWLGIADSWNCDQNIETKEGMLALPAGKIFEASYSLEIIS